MESFSSSGTWREKRNRLGSLFPVGYSELDAEGDLRNFLLVL